MGIPVKNTGKKTWFMIVLLSIGIVITFFYLKGRTNSPHGELPKVQTRDLLLYLENNSQPNMYDIHVELPDTIIRLSKLPHGKFKAFKVSSAYSYAYIQFYDSLRRKYELLPVDYIDETLYTNGKMKYIIEKIDTSKRDFIFNSMYIPDKQ